jgi:hypothetical protein
MARSPWMAGRATFTEEIINGPIKEVNVATKRADRSRAVSESIDVTAKTLYIGLRRYYS